MYPCQGEGAQYTPLRRRQGNEKGSQPRKALDAT